MVNLSRQKGQAMVEAVLIISLFLVTTKVATDYMKDNEVIRNMVEKPWDKIKNMMETGTWKDGYDQAVVNHPSHKRRHVSLKGDTPQ